jgi:hypothetical protein
VAVPGGGDGGDARKVAKIGAVFGTAWEMDPDWWWRAGSVVSPHLKMLGQYAEQHHTKKIEEQTKKRQLEKSKTKAKKADADVCTVSAAETPSPTAGGIRALLDSGADVHILPAHLYDQALYGDLRPARVALWKASGRGLNALGVCQVTGKIGNEGQRVKCEFVVCTAKQPLVSTRLLTRGGARVVITKDENRLEERRMWCWLGWRGEAAWISRCDAPEKFCRSRTLTALLERRQSANCTSRCPHCHGQCRG